MNRSRRRKRVTYDGSERRWHVIRGIPVAMIVSMLLMILAQTATAAWWASGIDKRMEDVERMQSQMAPQAERLTRLEEKVVAVQAGVSRIESLLTKPVSR